ncbi:protein similar isoform X2 [Prorops nasuta]|uniref:protein similar isoform X2 n=1 Tax=Prorops nasuta TaxID=863751 RepID=UPI0034CDDD16
MESQKKVKHKEKRRSNEKRKERSRDAARCRRSRETDIFTELAAVLPISPDQAAHLDKASIMRLAIAYLKARAVVDAVPGPLAKTEACAEMDELFLRALNGFMLVLSGDGNMVYLSENVSDYLGVSQMDLMGQSIYEYSHPCDHDELRECLESKSLDINEKRVCSFFQRFKCTLTSKGRKVNLKSASYKVIHCTGRLTKIHDPNPASSPQRDSDEQSSEDEIVTRDSGISLVLVGCPIPHPSNIEIPLGRQTFLSKHSLGMKFTYADEKLAEYLGWSSDELMGQSVFEFHHALDNSALDKSFKSLFSKGQCETVAYRFLGRRGGYAWVVTQATLIHCSKQRKPLSVVCVNYILSGVEREDEVYSARQLAVGDSLKQPLGESSSTTILEQIVGQKPAAAVDIGRSPGRGSSKVVEEEVVRNAVAEIPREDRPLTVTASIFRQIEPKEQELALKDKEELPGPVIVLDSVARSYPPLLDAIDLQEQRKPVDIVLKVPKHPVDLAVPLVVHLPDPSCLEDSSKDTPRIQSEQERRAPAQVKEFIFQGKPAIELDDVARRGRPQAVTRQLFAPLVQQQEQPLCRPPPQTATASIFAPRTKDMNKGFLTFSEDQPGLTMLKDEPEDLTHLAPTPGDVCVPLEDTPFFTDMLDEFILGNDNYCPLLSPTGATTLNTDLRSTDLTESLKDSDLSATVMQRSKIMVDGLSDGDPFMYGDSPGSPCSIDPTSSSSPLNGYRQSPERSMDSLSSPTEGSGGEGTLSEDEMLMLGIGDGLADDELALRAPYIPMSDQDEALELLISDDMVMWGPTQPMEKQSKWYTEEKVATSRSNDSSLAQLLRTDQIASRRYNDHGGGLVNPMQVLGQICRKSNTAIQSGRWKTERANKRIHASSTDHPNSSVNKRMRCDGGVALSSTGKGITFNNGTLYGKSHGSRRSATNKASANGNGVEMLRSIVSQHCEPRNDRSSSEVKRDITVDPREPDGKHLLNGSNTVNEASSPLRMELQSQQQNSPSNSVLMNLLVSGCDDTIMGSRNVPSLTQKNLASPLTVDLDNQLVPRCRNGGISLDHLSLDTRCQLIASFSSEKNILSPTPTLMNFDQLDYEVGNANGSLFQSNDLLDTLLDRNLV